MALATSYRLDVHETQLMLWIGNVRNGHRSQIWQIYPNSWLASNRGPKVPDWQRVVSLPITNREIQT